jgi:sialate O-acetylesterase
VFALGLLGIAHLSLPAVARAQESELLSPLFQSNMVLQADRPVTLKGRAAPRSEVRIAFADREIRATANEAGEWQASVVPRRQDAPITIAVADAMGNKAEVANILIGDVWLCSGQSNMDYALRFSSNAERVMREAGKSRLRIAKFAKTSVPAPTATPPYEIDWTAANPAAVADFSAVCWHMGLKLEKEIQGPIGLIHSSLGGSRIEDWMSLETVKQMDGLGDIPELLEIYAKDTAAARRELWSRTDAWAARQSNGDAGNTPWSAPEFDDADWQPIIQPEVVERAGIEELADFNGVIWLRTGLSLDAQQAGKAAVLELGFVNERDSVWVNGVRIGDSETPRTARAYSIPAGLLREGANTIAIRVIDETGAGGIGSSNNPWQIAFADGAAVGLPNQWRYKIAVSFDGDKDVPAVPWLAPRGYTTLYNGMIAPLAGLSLKGVAWYQGESNARDMGNPSYDSLFRAWIADWRRLFNDPQLPVVMAQLPNYQMPPTAADQESKWAVLREGQRVAANEDEHVSLAILIDQGVVDDIHPAHKNIVGERMAVEALRVAYGRTDLAPHFYPVSVRRQGGDVIIEYPDTLRGLQVAGGRSAIGFALCSVDDHCTFADGSLRDNAIILSDPGKAATHVTYAWSDSPITNFFSGDWAPAMPFRLPIAAGGTE